MPMTHLEALQVLAENRRDLIVIPTMGSITLWPKLSDTALDFPYMPSAMGQAPGLGLGLALARPERGVVVVNGDGSMLMNLGSLVTLANHPAALYLMVIDNGLYEITGGQPTAGSGRVDFATLARAAGIRRVYTFATVAEWRADAGAALSGIGPVVIWLKVEGQPGQKTPTPPRPLAQQIERLRQAFSG